MASLIFLFKETSFVRRKFFATCCVIVEAPSNLLFESILSIFFITALVTPFASMPGWSKKFLSSADRKELITLSGIELNGINSLFSIANSPINSPLSAYTLLKTDGS